MLYETLGVAGQPDYSDLPWEMYLAPEPFVYYSPTRGCYWNKCTFCDYGLNGDAPTSPWRHDPIDKIVHDVSAIRQQSKFIYFSVDVLAPAMMLRFAEAVVENGIDICWGAEIRLEKYWDEEKCRTLRKSGCVAVSVGFESGNQRTLDRIDKGTTVNGVERTVRNLHAAGIAVQMMGFTGFPGETLPEAMDSVSFLRETRELWTLGGLGSFVLTPGAIVAKKPEEFGVRNVAPRPGADIQRSLRFSTDDELSEAEARSLSDARKSLDETDFDRPWFGGVDTCHSYLYHARYGTRVVDVIGKRRRRAEEATTLNGQVIAAPSGHGFVYDKTGKHVCMVTLAQAAGAAPAAFYKTDGSIQLHPSRVLAWLRSQDRGSDPAFTTVERSDLNTEKLASAAVRERVLVPRRSNDSRSQVARTTLQVEQR